MSDIVTLMETYIENERYPNLVKFCNDYKDHVKDYICHFEDVEHAKKNLQNKMKIAFVNVRGKKRRGPGVQIDLKPLHAEARAMSSITTTGWNALSASVVKLGNAIISQENQGFSENNVSNPNHGKGVASSDNSENEGVASSDMSENESVASSNTSEDESVASSNTSEDESVASSNTSEDEGEADIVSSAYNLFKTYKDEAVLVSEKEGFYINGDLHEILCLSDILLLKEDDYSDKQLKHFGGTTNLEKIRNAVINHHVDSNVKFDTHIYNQISEILRNRCCQKNSRIMKEKINDVAKSADADDYRMIDIIINCINKISDSTRVNEEIGEAELQGNYIDPIMYPMFHNPQANMHFRWLNRQVADTVTRRPDGHIYKMRQRKIHSSIGFVEVKPNKSECAKRHEDMIRLAVFCKDALESQKSNNMIAVQVVGFYISFYLLASTDDDYYLMVELYSFETAKYLSQLPHLLSSFDNLKQIMAFNKNNAELQETTTKKRSRSQDTPDLTRIINIKKPKSVAPSLSFHK